MKLSLQTALLGCTLALSGCGVLPSGLADSDAQFLHQAAHGGFAEVEGSRLAQRKATHPLLRSFAERMIEDHLRSNAELARLAESKGVELPRAPSAAQKGRLRALSSLDGLAFDRQYIDQMGVMAHENTMALYRQASANAKDPDVKAFATRTLPVLNQHLDAARQVRNAVGR